MASEVHTVSCLSGSDKVECQGLLGDMGVSDYNENTRGESMTILQRTRKLLTLGLPAGSVSGFCAKF